MMLLDSLADGIDAEYDDSMSQRHHYPRAPIAEAIIDIVVEPAPEVTMADLAKLLEPTETLLTRQEKLTLARGQVEFRPGAPAKASASEEEHGLKFSSEEGKDICQARLNGYGFNRLAPYEDWERFSGKAARLWRRYRLVARPAKILRLAVRYINRIDIPAVSVDMKEYFLTSPEVSSKLPQQMAGFFMQVRLPQEDIAAMLILNETIIPPHQPESTSIVLDLDLFRDQDVPQDDDAIWSYFEVLHTRKNEVFEACITDRTRELFQ